jgi:hypothetical protein
MDNNGNKTSCKRKGQLYFLSKDSNDINLIKYYKQYCKILARVLTEAERSKYNNQIISSTNKMKTYKHNIQNRKQID